MSELFLKGSPIGKVKGILFDKDGTLSNSEEYLLSLSKYRIEESIKFFSQKKINQQVISDLENLLTKTYGVTSKGLKPDSTLAVASREHNIISTATVFSILGQSWPSSIFLANKIFNKADNLNKSNFRRPLLPGFMHFLNKLIDKNIICSLISNDNNLGITDFLTNNNLDQKITHYWSCENNPQKPNPDAVKKLCNRLKLNPKDCALIGDADTDLQMAKEAGIGLVLGYTGGWKNSPLLHYQHHLIHHWDEISIV